MFFLLKLLAATLIAASAYASSNDTVPPLKITALKIRKHAYANVSIVFAVDDPDPLTNSTALCAGSWAVHSKGYPQGSYELCGNSIFAWHMESYQSIRSFELGIEHSYIDPAVGEAPYDVITNFAKVVVEEPSLECKAHSGVHKCAQGHETIIEAPIWATIAKLR